MTTADDEQATVQALAELDEQERRAAVGYTPAAERDCAACHTPLADQAVYFPGRYYHDPLCADCALEPGYQQYVNHPFRRGDPLTKDEWQAQYASGKLLPARPCEVCGHEIAWLHPRYSSIRVCSNDCAAERLNRRRRVKHEPRICPVCDETFTPTRSDAATCSDRCRQRLRRSRLSAEQITEETP